MYKIWGSPEIVEMLVEKKQVSPETVGHADLVSLAAVLSGQI